MSKIISTLFFTCISLFVMAQDTPTDESVYDVIYLFNGSEFRGQIKDINADSVKVEIRGGHLVSFGMNTVKKIVQEPTTLPVIEREKPYSFKEKGFYNLTYGAFQPGRHYGTGDPLLGVSAGNVIGYQFDLGFGAGIGFGMDVYNFGTNEILLPLFIETRGYFLKRNISPYYSFNFGYAFGVKDVDNFLMESKGGFLLYPAAGIRFGSGRAGSFTMDIGYKRQEASFIRQGWGWNELVDQKKVFKRFVLRLGLLF